VDNKPFRILAIAGSLRQGSYNRGLLRAAQEHAPDWVEVQFFDIGTLPFFNEDVEANGDPEAVRRLKDAISRANAVLIATPEYNGAVPGVLANAIDWASRSPGKTRFAQQTSGSDGSRTREIWLGQRAGNPARGAQSDRCHRYT
jgi:chromate reductase